MLLMSLHSSFNSLTTSFSKAEGHSEGSGHFFVSIVTELSSPRLDSSVISRDCEWELWRSELRHGEEEERLRSKKLRRGERVRVKWKSWRVKKDWKWERERERLTLRERGREWSSSTCTSLIWPPGCRTMAGNRSMELSPCQRACVALIQGPVAPTPPCAPQIRHCAAGSKGQGPATDGRAKAGSRGGVVVWGKGDWCRSGDLVIK